MDEAELDDLVAEEDSAVMKTIKGATTGLVAGTIWGTVVATWYDVPRVERKVALPGLIRTLRMHVRQLRPHLRRHRRHLHRRGAADAEAPDEQGLHQWRRRRFRRRSHRSRIQRKKHSNRHFCRVLSRVHFRSARYRGRTARVDTGKEYYPYMTTGRKPAATQ